MLKEYDDKKEKIKNKDFIRPLDLARVAKVSHRMRQFIEDFGLFIKTIYRIVRNVERKWIVKTQAFEKQIKES